MDAIDNETGKGNIVNDNGSHGTGKIISNLSGSLFRDTSGQ